MRRFIAALTIIAVIAVAVGVYVLRGHGDAPYAGLDQREIKALAPERIEGLRRGEGLGYALAAELNDVAGPKHALELDLGLTSEQREAIETIRATMSAEAQSLGTELIEAERALDVAFASGSATPDEVGRLTAEAAAIEARLRAAHLNAHLAVDPLLTDDQRAAYAAARGYGEHGGHTGH